MIVVVVVAALVTGVIVVLISSGGGSKGTVVGTTTSHRSSVSPLVDDPPGTPVSDTSTSAPSSTTVPSSPATTPTLPTHPPTTSSTHRTTTTAASGPSGSPVVASDPATQGLYLVDADSGAIHPVLLDYTFGSVSFSPDGQQLVFDGRASDALPNGAIPTHLWIINHDGSGMHEVAAGTEYPEGPSWSPDGKSIAYYGQPVNANGDISLYLLDVSSGSTRFLAYVDQGRGRLEWSPDGRQIAVAAFNHRTIELINPATGTLTEAPVPAEPVATNFGNNFPYEVSWTKDSSHLVVSYQTGPVLLADAAGHIVATLNTQGRYAQASPVDAVFSEWINFDTYLEPLSGGSARLLASNVDPIDWSHDGQFLAGETGDNTVLAIDPSTGQTRTLVQDTHWQAGPAGWSPVGHTMAVVVEQTGSRRT
ncbi:MAG: TolB family protein [Acidimicrobiales bacterium]